MPMKIECADCAGWTGLFNKCKTCKGSKTITVHTDRELKQAVTKAKIEAYEDALSTVKYHLGTQAEYFIERKITALKQSMEE